MQVKSLTQGHSEILWLNLAPSSFQSFAPTSGPQSPSQQKQSVKFTEAPMRYFVLHTHVLHVIRIVALSLCSLQMFPWSDLIF